MEDLFYIFAFQRNWAEFKNILLQDYQTIRNICNEIVPRSEAAIQMAVVLYRFIVSGCNGDSDLGTSLFHDFGEFIQTNLLLHDLVEMTYKPTQDTTHACFICLDDFKPDDKCLYHHSCQTFTMHQNCAYVWMKAGNIIVCTHCVNVI